MNRRESKLWLVAILVCLGGSLSASASHDTRFKDLPIVASDALDTSGWASFHFTYDGTGSALFLVLDPSGGSSPDAEGLLLYDEGEKQTAGVLSYGGRILGDGECAHAAVDPAGQILDSCRSPSVADSAFLTALDQACRALQAECPDHSYLGLQFEPGKDPAGEYKLILFRATRDEEPWRWEVRGTGVTILATMSGDEAAVFEARDFNDGLSASARTTGVMARVNWGSTIRFNIDRHLIGLIYPDGGPAGAHPATKVRLSGPGFERDCYCSFYQLHGLGSGPPGDYRVDLSGVAVGEEFRTRALIAIVDADVPR